MANLFVIGNGFDLSHGLKTSYEDFHEYLKRTYPQAKVTYDVFDCFDKIQSTRDIEHKMNVNGAVGFIKGILSDTEGEHWSNLESSIGKIDFKNYIEDVSDEENEWKQASFNEINSKDLIRPILEIPYYFSEWILTIKIDKERCQKDFMRLINKEEDFFLTFNYTKTLEYLYDIENACHIHGVQGEKLIFGHGNNINYLDEESFGLFLGAEENFQWIHNELRKDTKKMLKQNKPFFESLKSIDKIYSYGFSFEKVDKVYIKEICEKLDTESVTWYINDFDNETIQNKYKKVITECGFKGFFDSYNVKI